MAVFIHCIMIFTVVTSLVGQVSGHGRMIEPASRNSMWRHGYKNPRNYNDMGLNCGGFTNQFERNGGRCGVCGDPPQGPGEHEAGGRYARGVVARQYAPGTYINVTVELTSNHMGYFEFRLCPVNDPHKKATHACLNRHLLTILGHGTRYFIARRDTSIITELFVMLPPNLKCSQCVLQWKWVAGQSMGPDGYGGECLGCGNQENFVNCADIAIGSAPVQPLPMPAGGFTEPKPVPPPKAKAYANYGGNAGNTGYASGPALPAGPAYQTQGTQGMQGLDPNMANIIAQVYKMASKANRAMPPKVTRWNPPTPIVPKIVVTTPVYQTTTASWLNQPSWQQQANSWNPPSAPIQAPNPVQAVPNFMNQQTGWNQNMVQSAPSIFQQNSEYNPTDYAGNEPGEYPELSEMPPPGVQTHSNTNQYPSASSASASYQKGFIDAVNQLKLKLGLSNGHTSYSGKINTALSELSVTMQESQKPNIGAAAAASSSVCPGGVPQECIAGGAFHGNSDFDMWCTMSCATGQCPANMCSCTCPGGGGAWEAGAGAGCRAVDRTKGASMDTWCTANCKQNNCPSDLCVCGYST